MTKNKFKLRKQVYTLWVMNRKQRSLDLISFINIFLSFLIFSNSFVKLLNSFHSEMQNEKTEFMNFSILVLEVFNVI